MKSYEAVKALGITYRQLDHWIRQGYIGGGNPGSGHQRELSIEEFAELAAMAALVKAGFTPAVAAQMARGVAA